MNTTPMSTTNPMTTATIVSNCKRCTMPPTQMREERCVHHRGSRRTDGLAFSTHSAQGAPSRSGVRCTDIWHRSERLDPLADDTSCDDERRRRLATLAPVPRFGAGDDQFEISVGHDRAMGAFVSRSASPSSAWCVPRTLRVPSCTSAAMMLAPWRECRRDSRRTSGG
jgi:hypothetical protein